MLCLYFLCSNLKKLFGLTYVHPYPQHMATPRPTMYARYHVYTPSVCGISMQISWSAAAFFFYEILLYKQGYTNSIELIR